MKNFLTLATLLLIPATRSVAQVPGRNQVAFVVDRSSATTASEVLFSMNYSTYSASAVGINPLLVNRYTISAGKALYLTNLTMSVEAGGSAPALSRVAFKVRTSTSSLAGDCTVTNPLIYDAMVSVAGTLHSVTNLVAAPNVAIQGNGKTTICFTQFAPDWVSSTNVSSTTLTLNGYEQ